MNKTIKHKHELLIHVHVMYTNIDQKLVNSLHVLLNCEIGGVDCRVIITRCPLHTHVSPIVQCAGPCNLFGSVWSVFLCNIQVKTTTQNNIADKCNVS